MARRLLSKIFREEIAMRKVSLLSALLPIVLIACGEDSSPVVEPPVSLTPEEQIVVTNCEAIRDALETYAASHGGSYGQWNIPDLGLGLLENPYTGEIGTRVRAAYPGQIGLESYVVCGGNVAGYRITGYGKNHMLITLESLANVPPDDLHKHDETIANAYLVMDAALRWAAAYDGHYSSDVNGDTNHDGKTLIDMLSNGELLINAYSGMKTEPADGLALGNAGTVGYLGADSGDGFLDSFNIEAYSCDGDVMITLTSYSEGEYRVSGQSNLLRDAIEAFKQSSGHYPNNLETEITPGGKTVSQLYFESATDEFTIFVNPYTGDHDFPFIGTAANRGEIAYQPIETASVVTGYVITARGLMNEIVHLGPNP